MNCSWYLSNRAQCYAIRRSGLEVFYKTAYFPPIHLSWQGWDKKARARPKRVIHSASVFRLETKESWKASPLMDNQEPKRNCRLDVLQGCLAWCEWQLTSPGNQMLLQQARRPAAPMHTQEKKGPWQAEPAVKSKPLLLKLQVRSPASVDGKIM